jgi:hypothetical protein
MATDIPLNGLKLVDPVGSRWKWIPCLPLIGFG